MVDTHLSVSFAVSNYKGYYGKATATRDCGKFHVYLDSKGDRGYVGQCDTPRGVIELLELRGLGPKDDKHADQIEAVLQALRDSHPDA